MMSDHKKKVTSDLRVFTARRRIKMRNEEARAADDAPRPTQEDFDTIAPPRANLEGRVVDGVRTFGAPMESEKVNKKKKK